MKPKKIIDSLDEYEQDLEDNFEQLVDYTPEEEKIKIAELVKAAKSYNAKEQDLA